MSWIAELLVLPSPHSWPMWWSGIVFPLNRWLHLVGSTVLVGGVLFFEFVVPIATADLKPEQQLSVFGRARWVFRRVFWFSVVALLISGLISTWRLWPVYEANQAHIGGNFWYGAKPWVLGHAVVGLVGFGIVMHVTTTRRIRSHPIGWLRVAMVVLLTVMFAASVARHVRLRLSDLHASSMHADG